jgi:hypothetical protein
MKTTLFNPFARIAGVKALLAGAATVLLSAALCYFSHVQFDGIIDTHFSGVENMAQSFKEVVVDSLSIVLIFYLSGLIAAGNRFRFVDIAGTMLFARIPMTIIPLFALIFSPEKLIQYILYTFLKQGTPVTLNFMDIFGFVITSLITILMVIWMIALMWNAFRICMNSRKPKIIVMFIAGLILAEIVSKITLIYL